MSWEVHTSLYVSAENADTDGRQAMVNALQSKGWRIVWADIGPLVDSGFGFLATGQPFSVLMDRPGSTQEDAATAVQDAVKGTGNTSFAGTVITDVSSVADAGAKVASGIGIIAQKIAANPPTGKQALLAVEIVAVVVGLLALSYLAFKVGPILAEGAKVAGSVAG